MTTLQTDRVCPLSAAQVAQFEREGYLVVDEVFGDDVLRAAEEELTAEIDARARELVAKGQLSRTYAEADFLHRLALISAETEQLALSIWDGSLSGAAIFDLIRYPPLLDIAGQLCQSDELIASSVYRVRPKIPSNTVKSPVPWHQDSGYFEPYCDRSLILTCWLPLVDATEDNGCLWVKPRSHKGAVIEHVYPGNVPYLMIRDRNLPEVESVCCPVRRGGALFLTNLTPHASFANKTDIVRWSMDLRYQSAALPTNAPITRLPGEVAGGAGQDIPAACFPPEADFLVRSRQRPEQVTTTAEEFHRLRKAPASDRVSPRWKGEPA